MIQSRISANLFNPAWGSPVERERKRRINLTLWAYAYEMRSAPLVHDDHYDMVARASRPTLRTGRLDEWWRENFTPSSGIWINDHPYIDDVAAMYDRLTRLLR